MPTYKAPVEDVQFLLNDVFHIERYGNLPGFADASPDVVEAILGEAAKFCRGGAARRSIASATSKAASATTTAASRRRRASRKPTSRSSTAAGSASRCRPNSAGRACRRR